MKVSSYYSHKVNPYSTARSNLVNPPYSFLFSTMTANTGALAILLKTKREYYGILDPWVRWQYFLFIDKFEIETRRQKNYSRFHENILTKDYSGRNYNNSPSLSFLPNFHHCGCIGKTWKDNFSRLMFTVQWCSQLTMNPHCQLMGAKVKKWLLKHDQVTGW